MRDRGTEKRVCLIRLIRAHHGAHTHAHKRTREEHNELKQDSQGGGGRCDCGSVEEGELCELTCGTAAMEAVRNVKHSEKRVYLIRAH